MKRSGERRALTAGTPRDGVWPFLAETRIGSTTPLGCVVQTLLTGAVTALVIWLALTFA